MLYNARVMPSKGAEWEVPETAPVFPLPNVVLFPRTVLPLHIFEERYKAMAADAVRGDGCIAMALLLPGWERDYDGNPAYHPVGCLGRMTDVVKTEDGRYGLELIGVRKVSLGDIVSDHPYRTARIRSIEETMPGDLDPTNRDELVRLIGACAVLVHELSEKSFSMAAVKEGLPYEAVVNSICFHAGLPPALRQSLLEVDDVRQRCLKLTDMMETKLQQLVLSREAQPGRPEAGWVN